MGFTDDELSALKRAHSIPGIGDQLILRLIERLEAAEAILKRYPSFIDSFNEYYAWRHSKGE